MRENPLPLLLLFLSIAILPSVARAQLFPPESKASQEEPKAPETADRKRTRLNFGPHRKNPLAAGRLSRINRKREAAPLARRPLPRRRGQRSSSTFTALDYQRLPPVKEQTTGPRYKNRQSQSTTDKRSQASSK